MNPTDGEVFAVRGSPGPASGISIDVVARGEFGDEFYNDILPFGLPTEFDVSILVGTPVLLSFRGNEVRCAVAWLPVTTECV